MRFKIVDWFWFPETPQSVRDADKKMLDPIVGESYETGLKAEFLDGRLNASAAIFQIKQDNLAQSTGVIIPGSPTGELAYEASEGATSKGFELEVSGELAQGWNLTAGYTQFNVEDAEGDTGPAPTRIVADYAFEEEIVE